MYRILSSASFIVRFAICYVTIEAVPIVESELMTIILAQAIPTYTVLRIISYGIVSALGYERGSAPGLGVFLYFIVYLPLALLLWLTLLLLTWLNVLPIPI